MTVLHPVTEPFVGIEQETMGPTSSLDIVVKRNTAPAEIEPRFSGRPGRIVGTIAQSELINKSSIYSLFMQPK
jgi:hypothetical protein